MRAGCRRWKGSTWILQKEVGLTGFEERYPHELSGGMRQRVGLARAMAVDADVLLMDEPFSAVDEQTRRKFQEDLLNLLSVEKKTVIFVTHSIEEAVYFSSQVVLLSRRPGRVSKMLLIPPFTDVLRACVELLGSESFHRSAGVTLSAFASGMGIAIAASSLIEMLERRIEYYAGARG